MNAEDANAWDDWTRPAPRWPAVVVVLAPLIEIGIAVWLVSRVLGS